MTRAPTTAYAHLSSRAALAILLVWLLATAISILAADHVYRDFAPPTSDHGPGSGDWALYRAIADRLAAGEPYYETLGAELLARDYPRASVFNWRTPAHLWIVTRPGGQILAPLILGLCTVASLILGWRILRRSVGPIGSGLGVLALGLALAPAVSGDVYLLSEVCAGTLVTLSALLFADRRPKAGLVAALGAIFLREFALIFYAVAAMSRSSIAKRKEAAVWIGGGVAWSVYFAFHAWRVIGEAGQASGQPGHWLGGGVPFVLSTIEQNALLNVLPGAVVAALAPALLLGTAAIPGRAAQALRVVGLAYVFVFLFVGRPIHPYWGNLYAPMLSLGIPLAIPALIGLLRRARGATDDLGTPEKPRS